MIVLLVTSGHTVVLHARQVEKHTLPEGHVHPAGKLTIGQSSKRHKMTASLQDDAWLTGQTTVKCHQNDIAQQQPCPQQILLLDSNQQQNGNQAVIYAMILQQRCNSLAFQLVNAEAKHP